MDCSLAYWVKEFGSYQKGHGSFVCSQARSFAVRPTTYFSLKMTLYTEQLILGNLHMNIKTRNFQPDKVQNED